STAIMLMGIAFIYGGNADAASFYISNINLGTGKMPVMIATGLVFLMFSMAFKVSAAPFHFWTPDVYDGAPTVFTSFMATIVKVAAFIAFMRLFNDEFGSLQSRWQLLIALITAITLFIGNITAVFQQSVKRMLAYSSISQAGFMMMAIFAMNADAREGLLLYSAAYCLATIGIFAVLMKLKDYSFDGFNAFAKQQPLMAATTTIFLLSLAGIPLTAGFLSKFWMIKAVAGTGKYLWLVIFTVLMAVVSVYYYFRVIQAMYFKEGDGQTIEASLPFKWTLALLAGIVVLLGVFPNWIIYWLYF